MDSGYVLEIIGGSYGAGRKEDSKITLSLGLEQ